jgi:hypothetical protein
MRHSTNTELDIAGFAQKPMDGIGGPVIDATDHRAGICGPLVLSPIKNHAKTFDSNATILFLENLTR